MKIFDEREIILMILTSLFFSLSFSFSHLSFLNYFLACIIVLLVKSIFLKFHGKKHGLWFKYEYPLYLILISFLIAIFKMRFFIFGFFYPYFFLYERYKMRTKYPIANEIGKELTFSSLLISSILFFSSLIRLRELFDASFWLLITTLLPFKDFEGGKIFFYNYSYWGSLLILSIIFYIFGW